MSGFLRFIGIVNAAIWFGAVIFFAAAVLPAVFSHDMRQLFGEAAYPYFSGAVAMTLFRRFFLLQYVCGAIALLHLMAEKLYLGRNLPRIGTALVVVLFSFSLIGGLGLEPHMERLRATMYSQQPPAVREQARHSFGLWHGLSQLANLFILGGLVVHLFQVARPTEPGRFGTFYQLRS